VVGTESKLVGLGGCVRTERGSGHGRLWRTHAVRQASGAGRRAGAQHLGVRGEDFGRMGLANVELGRTADAGWALLTSFHLFKVFAYTFKCPKFEITKHSLPDIKKFPKLAWLQIISNRTLFLFDLTSKLSCPKILNFGM
jgi:hypothetical protein